MAAEPRSLLPQLALSAALIAWGLATTDPSRGARSEAELDRMDAAYYERVTDIDRRLELALSTPPPPPFKDGPLALAVDDIRECVLVPSLETTFQGARWTTDALGLRDRAYPPRKPEGTTRIVLLGDSIGVGWGVDDGEGFEPLLERSLDRRSRSRGGPAVEVLNLCVPGYAPGQRLAHLRRLGWSLAPDLVLYQATAADLAWDERRLRALLPEGIGWDEPMYRDVLRSAGIRPGDDRVTIKHAIRPRRWAIVEGVYRALVANAADHQTPIAYLMLPRVGRTGDREDRRGLLAAARRAGFDPVIDLSDAFDGRDPAALAVGPDDYHPNADGHRLLADRLIAAAAQWPLAAPPLAAATSRRDADDPGPAHEPDPSRDPCRPASAGGGAAR